MQAQYRRENHKNYMVVSKEMEDYGISMIQNNSMPGFLPISCENFNGEEEFLYDISNKQTISMLYEKKEIEYEDFIQIWNGLRKITQQLESYLMDYENVVLDPDYVFKSSKNGELFVCYYPQSADEYEEAITKLSEFFLDRVCNDDEKAVYQAYNFYKIMREECGDIVSTLEQMKTLEDKSSQDTAKEEDLDVSSKESEIMQMPYEENELHFYETPLESAREEQGGKKHILASNIEKAKVFFLVFSFIGVGTAIFRLWNLNLEIVEMGSDVVLLLGLAAFITGIALFFISGYLCKKWKRELKEQRKEESKEIEQSFVVSENEFYEYSNEENNDPRDEESYETVLIQEKCYSEQRILSGKIRGKKKQIDLSSFPFVIGKDRDQVDFCIEDNSVSRVHARFTLRDDIVYLSDCNSTNGTYKNGVRIEPNELVPMEAEDELAFGRVTFTYH